MFWLLVALLLLLCVVALAVTLLTLWRRVKGLGGAVTTMGDALAAASAQADALRTARTPPPCATCGAPASAATKPPTEPAGRRTAA